MLRDVVALTLWGVASADGSLPLDPWQGGPVTLHQHDAEVSPSMAMYQVESNQSRTAFRRPVERLGVTPAGRVKHVEMLNQEEFWWLMAAVVLCVGLAVVRIEVDSVHESPALEEKPLRQKAANYDGNEGSRDQHLSGAASPDPAAEAVTWNPRRILHLCACGAALNAIQLCWGVLQEYVMTRDYVNVDGTEAGSPDVQFIVLCNRVSACLIAGIILLVRGQPLMFDNFSQNLWPAITNIAASWCQYRALLYISFVLQTTAKSAKLLPVLILDKLRGKHHTVLDFAEALVIFAGLTVFAMETSLRDSAHTTTLVGVGMLVASVIFDSLTPHLQDMAFKSDSAMSPLKMCFSMSCIAMIVLFMMQCMTGALLANAAFFWGHPGAILQLCLLSSSSFLTQYFICYTIGTFGPVMFTLLASLRQILAVGCSALLFDHSLSDLAVISMVIILSTVVLRVVREPRRRSRPNIEVAALGPESARDAMKQLAQCAAAIHVLYCFYTLAQEFLATHTFSGEIFKFPIFIVAMNHTCGALFALFAMWVNSVPFQLNLLPITSLPAASNFVGTCSQHAALYFMLFPAQTMMKTLKVVPVMLTGRVLKNRHYTPVEYAEGMLITMLAGYFVWDFHLGQRMAIAANGTMWIGVTLMAVYIFADSFTSNLEDYTYQQRSIDPGHLLFGMEVVSAVVAWTVLLWEGTLIPAVSFLAKHHLSWFYVVLLAVASGSGAYACTVTVRKFGPSVFTLLMTSRQIVSLVLSVVVFQHSLTSNDTFCLVVVAAVILTSSVRRVSMDHHARDPQAA